MKRTPKFYIADVFCTGKYTGNQLAVFVNCDDFSDEEMQKVSKEMNFSETTFVGSKPLQSDSYTVRIFTPCGEIPFAGHPILGTAFIIRNFVALNRPNELILNLKIGKIPVTTEGDLIWMNHMEPEFGEIIDKKRMAAVLGLSIEDISSEYPIQEVSTGLPVMIVPLKTLNILKKVKVDREKYFNLVKAIKAKGIFVFCPQGYEKDQDMSTRMFVEYYGIPEDPATGSASGCLAAYLVNTNYFNIPAISKKIGQGYEIGRPSLLYIKAEKKDNSIKVQVGGKVHKVAEGFWVED